jgi:hypothetical protein
MKGLLSFNASRNVLTPHKHVRLAPRSLMQVPTASRVVHLRTNWRTSRAESRSSSESSVSDAVADGPAILAKGGFARPITRA